MTGMTSKTIHSGRLPEVLKALMTFNRLAIFLRRTSELASRISWRRSSERLATSTALRILRTASAPIPATNFPPYSSTALR